MIAHEIFRRVSIRGRLPQLLGGPSVGRRARHTNMDDFPRFQFTDEKRKERPKEQVSHLEEITGPDLSCMIVQKRPPALPRWARRTHAPHVFLNRAFAHAHT